VRENRVTNLAELVHSANPMRSLAALPLALLFLVACGDDAGDDRDDTGNDNTSDQDQDDQNQDDNQDVQPLPDATPDSSIVPDSSVPDGALPDGFVPDALVPDSATPDAAVPDASLPDASLPDASSPDAAVPDASSPDASSPDASSPDASSPDASSPDASSPDASSPPDAMVDGSMMMPDAATPDAATPDATTPDAPVDAGTSSCTIATTLGTVTPPGQFAEQTTQSASVPSYTYAGLLNQDANFDAIQFELWDGFGVFAAGIVPGTYQITGAELDYASCGACIFAFGDVTSTSITQAYFATGGTMTLTQVGPNMIGTLSNMTFGSLDNTTGDPDGLCTSSLTSFAFSVAITDNTARAAGKSGKRINFTPIRGKSPIAKSQVCFPNAGF